MMQIVKYPKRNEWMQILKRPLMDSSSLEKTVQEILNDVKQYGNSALQKYSRQFDKVDFDPAPLSYWSATLGGVRSRKAERTPSERGVGPKGLSEESTRLLRRGEASKELKLAIQFAKRNIEKFHLAQKEKVKVIKTSKGVKCWRKSVPIEKVGLYIPGGSAPLFSTILMLGIPARIAGCKEIIMCTPANTLPNGEGCQPDRVILAGGGALLYVAKLLGIKKVFRVGGAQAIGAMAYGTETIPKVNKIFGPGNQYVTCAKQLVQKDGVAIDMPAGPSEVAVLADKSCVPAFVASDLLSQAEHGTDSQVILVSDSEKVIDEVQKEIFVQLEKLPRKEIALKALQNSKAILIKNKKEAMDLLNEYAPEHLILSCKDADKLATKVVNAGSVFLGNYSPESAGDYASGTNHTLPTNGYAKSYSGVSLDSFVKKITFQKLSKDGLKKIGKAVALMAEAEGLDAHKNAVTLRITNMPR